MSVSRSNAIGLRAQERASRRAKDRPRGQSAASPISLANERTGPLEHGTEVIAAVSFLVIGLSHLLQPKAWVVFFQTLAGFGTAGAFLEGFFLLNFGAIIVGFHNVWHGPARILTLVGWAQVLKGLGRFIAPEFAVRIMARASTERAWVFQAGGAVALALAGFFGWLAISNRP